MTNETIKNTIKILESVVKALEIACDSELEKKKKANDEWIAGNLAYNDSIRQQELHWDTFMNLSEISSKKAYEMYKLEQLLKQRQLMKS